MKFIIDFLEKTFGIDINERYFTFFLIVITSFLVYFTLQLTDVSKGNVVALFSGGLVNLSMFITAILTFQYFQLGTSRDIQKEIFDEHNTAAAIYEAAFIIGAAIVIAKGLM